MKALMILGAIIGFLIGSGFGIASSSPWPAALWRGCAAAVLSAVLTRWWGRMWMSNLRDSLHHRHTTPNTPSADKKAASKL
jgi:hypothetical protein